MKPNIIPNVKYYDITHLYWGKFPYCITVSHVTFPAIYGNLDTDRANRVKQHLDKVSIINTILQLCPTPGSFKRVTDFIDDRYYFKSESDATEFIDSIMYNGKLGRIVAIGSPSSSSQLKIMQESSPDILFRHTLFFRKFEYKIIFKKLDWAYRQDLIAWIYDLYTDNTVDRFKCDKMNKKLTLLLTNSDDVMMTMLAYSHHIKKIEQVKLLP